MQPSLFLDELRAARATAILRTPLAAAAAPAMEAAIRGGFRIIEFTLNTPGALDLIRQFSACGDLIVGAGTVLSADEARAAVDAGAAYLVSPVVEESVIAAGKEMDIAVMPGCATPTEMLRAHRLGAPLQKLFPQVETGPAWVRQTLAPLPFLRIVPTSGVHLNNCAAYLKAGAFAVGFVASLFDGNDLMNAAYDRVEERARRMLQEIRAAV